MITLEILAAYLPFDVDTVTHSTFGDLRGKLTPQNLPNFLDGSTNAMLILRPLSDLKNHIIHNGEKFIPINKLKGLYGWDYLWNDYHKDKQPFNVNALKWASLVKLLEWNFNVFNLKENEYIRKG